MENCRTSDVQRYVMAAAAAARAACTGDTSTKWCMVPEVKIYQRFSHRSQALRVEPKRCGKKTKRKRDLNADNAPK